MWKSKDRDKVYQSIGRFLYVNSISFDVIKSPFLKPIIEEIEKYRPSLKASSYHEVGTTFFLEKNVIEMNYWEKVNKNGEKLVAP